MDDLIMHSPSLASDPWDVSVDPASRGPGHRAGADMGIDGMQLTASGGDQMLRFMSRGPHVAPLPTMPMDGLQLGMEGPHNADHGMGVQMSSSPSHLEEWTLGSTSWSTFPSGPASSSVGLSTFNLLPSTVLLPPPSQGGHFAPTSNMPLAASTGQPARAKGSDGHVKCAITHDTGKAGSRSGPVARAGKRRAVPTTTAAHKAAMGVDEEDTSDPAYVPLSEPAAQKARSTAARRPAAKRAASLGDDSSDADEQPKGKPRAKAGGKISRSKSSRYRGVTKHRRSGRYEAHLWIRELHRQVYLGGYEHEEHAAEAYDVAALKSKGLNVRTNFDISRYSDLTACMHSISLEELIMAVRRQSQGFSRGSSTYRGVTHHPSGRWEARIGIPGSKHIYLGLHDDEDGAARAYDGALVRLRGTIAATNFSLSDYRNELADYHHKQQEILENDQDAKLCSGDTFEDWVKNGYRDNVNPGAAPLHAVRRQPRRSARAAAAAKAEAEEDAMLEQLPWKLEGHVGSPDEQLLIHGSDMHAEAM